MIMKWIHSAAADPQAFLKKMTRVSTFLFLFVVVLMFVKYKQDESAKLVRVRDEHFQKVDEEKQKMEESHWEEDIKKILPDQEPLLTPHVLPQLLIPPIFEKIAVPRALVHLRQKRYTAAYEFQTTPYVAFWGYPASASTLEETRPLSFDLPAISPPLSKETTQPRKPRIPPGIGKTYILLP